MSFGSLTSVLARPPDVRSRGNIGRSALPSFELFFKRIAFSNERAYGTRQGPSAVRLQTRNDLADNVRRGRSILPGNPFEMFGHGRRLAFGPDTPPPNSMASLHVARLAAIPLICSLYPPLVKSRTRTAVQPNSAITFRQASVGARSALIVALQAGPAASGRCSPS